MGADKSVAAPRSCPFIGRLPEKGKPALLREEVGLTHEAVAELGLREGASAWALVKAVSTRGHVY